MDRSPELRLSAVPGAPNVTLIGVDALSPETFNPEIATEETERAQATTNQRRYAANVAQLVERVRLTAEGEV